MKVSTYIQQNIYYNNLRTICKYNAFDASTKKMEAKLYEIK